MSQVCVGAPRKHYEELQCVDLPTLQHHAPHACFVLGSKTSVSTPQVFFTFYCTAINSVPFCLILKAALYIPVLQY